MGYPQLTIMLDVLIIGCGNIAGRFDESSPGDYPFSHAGAMRAHGGFRIAACIEPNADRRAQFQSFWGVPFGAESWDGLAAKPLAFDVISICSPTIMHGNDLGKALELRPRLVFSEKPVTPTAEETAHWVQRYAEEDILLAVNHTRRWAPDVVELARQIADGVWGAVRSASAQYTKGIANNGSHMIDLLQLLIGPVHLIAAGRPERDFWPKDPSISALLQTTSGIPVTLNIGNAADYSLFELRLVTEKGVIDMLDGGMTWTTRSVIDNPDFPGYRSAGKAVAVEGQYAAAMSGAFSNIAAALDDGVPLACDGANALTTQRLCDAIKAAALTKSNMPNVP